VAQPLRVDRADEPAEQPEVLARYVVIFGISADCQIADRPLTTHGAIESIEADHLERIEIVEVPVLPLRLIVLVERQLLEPGLVGVFLGQRRDPVVDGKNALVVGYSPREGASEFFAVFSSNSMSRSPTRLAHHSTASITLRKPGSDSVSSAFSGV